MTTIPLERISAEARLINFGRMVLIALAALLYGIGWVMGALIMAAAWSFAAMKLGYLDARRPRQSGDS